MILAAALTGLVCMLFVPFAGNLIRQWVWDRCFADERTMLAVAVAFWLLPVALAVLLYFRLWWPAADTGLLLVAGIVLFFNRP